MLTDAEKDRLVFLTKAITEDLMLIRDIQHRLDQMTEEQCRLRNKKLKP